VHLPNKTVWLFLIPMTFASFANAADAADPTRTAIESLVDALVSEGVVPPAKRDEIVRRALERNAAEPLAPGEIQVQEVPEIVKDEIREQVRQDLKDDVVKDVIREARVRRWGVPGAWPEWVDRLKFSGDVRVRGQKDNYARDNADDFLNYQAINEAHSFAIDDVFLNSTQDRERLRVRARLALDAQISSGTSAGIRVSTGNLSDPVSTNQTLGNSGQPYQLVLDRAFLSYQTEATAVTVTGGRMPNPFLGTELVWDPDLNFDGVAVKVSPRHFGDEGVIKYALEPFVTVGAFPLQEVELSSQDKWLYGGQLGLHWKGESGSRFDFGVAYYAYENITGERNAVDSTLLDFTAPQFVQKGNSLFDISNDSLDPTVALFGLAPAYDELDIVIAWTLAGVLPVNLTLSADYVENIGFDRHDILARTGLDLSEETSGYGLRAAIGRGKLVERGDWATFVEIRHLEADAVVDAFTDSDFHLGGTNAEGWIAGVSYALRDHLMFTARYLSTDEIVGSTEAVLSDISRPFGVDTLQLDLTGSF
jgi:hypothetical protein